MLAAADQRYQFTQRERITFALVAQTEGLLAVELAEELELADTAALRPWLGRLLTLGLSIGPVARTPRAASCRPRSYAKPGSTRPRRSRGFRLAGCARSYLRISTASGLGEGRHPSEGGTRDPPDRTFRRALEELVGSGEVIAAGEKRWRTYRLKGSIGHDENDGQ